MQNDKLYYALQGRSQATSDKLRTTRTPFRSGTAVTCAIELVGMYISCSIIAAWASRFAAMNGARMEHDKNVDDVVAYMHSRKLPPALQRTVRAYFQYTWSTQQGLSEEEILKSLPGHLRTEALSFLQGAILKQ